MSADEAVIGTNDDAASCKRFGVDKGYWSDPYIAHFVQKSSVRKAPEISRGYYARVKSIEALVKNFLTLTDCKCQVVSLGAGFDTLFWRLNDEGLLPQCYLEIDFEPVTTKKCHFIKSKKQLLEALSGEDSEIMMSKSELHSANYHLVSGDLRNIATLETKLSASGIDRALPTVFLSECVLVYIEAGATEKLIKWIADSFPTALFINYEQVNMTDAFGQVMIQNLKARDCVLSGAVACASLETQMNRFLNNGWTGGDAMDLCTVYRCLPQADVQRTAGGDLEADRLALVSIQWFECQSFRKPWQTTECKLAQESQTVKNARVDGKVLQRMERLELLDERELLDQLLSHYCLVWAYKDTKNIGLHNISLT